MVNEPPLPGCCATERYASLLYVKTLDRYLWKECLLFFALCLFAFTGILLTLRMLRFASLVVDKGVELSQIGAVFLAIIPTFLEIATPLATLLGVMLAFGRLSGDSEIVVMRASGISIGQLTFPTFVFGFAIACLGLIVSLELKPWGFRELSRTLFEIARSKSTSGLEPGIFNKLGDITLYAEAIDNLTGNLTRVMVDDRRDAETRRVFLARTGAIRSDEVHRTIEFILRDAEIHEQSGKISPPWKSKEIRLSIDPNELFEQEHQKGRSVSELSVSELRERLAYLGGPLTNTASLLPSKEEIAASESTEDSVAVIEPGILKPEDYPLPVPNSVFVERTTREQISRRILRSQIELGQRFSLPFASLALALLAMPLGVQPPRAHRTWGAGLSAVLGLLVFVLYYGLFSVGLVLAQSGVIPTWLALWIPNLCVVALATLTTYKTATESWHSVSAALHERAIRFGQGIVSLFKSRKTA